MAKKGDELIKEWDKQVAEYQDPRIAKWKQDQKVRLAILTGLLRNHND